MSTIVTTSTRQRQRRSMALPQILLALLVVAGVAYLLIRKTSASSKPHPPVTNSAAKASFAAPAKPRDNPSNETIVDASTNPSATFLGTEASFDPSATNGMPVGTAVPRIKRKSKEQEVLQANYRYPTPGQARLPDGYIVTFNPPEEGHTVKFMVDHEKYVCYPDGTFEIIAHKPVFEDKFEEQMINLALPGATFLPHILLNHTEEELKAMLAREVVINPNDNDDVKEKKQAVAAMKRMISDYLADGGDYADFVMEMHKYSKEERKLRVKGLSKLGDLLDEGRVEDARVFLESYNAILDENGFAPLRLSKKVKAQLEDAEAEPSEQ